MTGQNNLVPPSVNILRMHVSIFLGHREPCFKLAHQYSMAVYLPYLQQFYLELLIIILLLSSSKCSFLLLCLDSFMDLCSFPCSCPSLVRVILMINITNILMITSSNLSWRNYSQQHLIILIFENIALDFKKLKSFGLIKNL